MNNLFSHIEYLLLSRDCVIAPGLGAFIAIVHQADIDYDRGIIAPPSRTVMFNQAISSDDGLLANSYVRKHNVSFEEARQIITREVSILKATLCSRKELTIGNLGTLKMGEEGNIIFIPRLDLKAANLSLGFDKVSISRPKESVTVKGSTTSVHATNDTDEETTEPEAIHTSYYQFRIGKTFSRIAAAFMIMALITIAAILKPIPSDTREQRASVIPVEAIMHAQINKVEKTNIITDSLGCDNETESIAEEASLPSHYLIVATFNSPKEARSYISSHSSDNWSMQAVESLKVTRVAIASSDNKDELRKTLNTKEIQSKYPNAWIWSRK